MKSLCELIDFIEPSVKASEKHSQSLLKDLSGSQLTSSHYVTLIEQVCDDLLEHADKQIDFVKSKV